MRILFVARAIHQMAGGVERMITTIMNALVCRGHHIEFMTWDGSAATSFYPLDQRVVWHRLSLGDPTIKATPWMKLRRLLMVRQLIRRSQPDVVVCFQSGTFFSVRLYTMGIRMPIIVAERNAPSRFKYLNAPNTQRLTYQVFRWAKRILVQCESYRSHYPEFLRDRIITIPNPVLPASQFAQPHIPNAQGRWCLLSVGRLSYQKNFAVLIQAFILLAPQFPMWDLKIVGAGEEQAALQHLIDMPQLGDRIALSGVTTAITEAYINAHLFCLPSLWEGFPNALAEALAHGLPGVGFAQCAGMADLITPGQNGVLAPGINDPAALAATLAPLMQSAQQRQNMGQNAIMSIREYEPVKIFNQWQGVLSDVVQT
ncbi:glycosyltransferase [Halomicronema sp. CCY15110]|uniref:glycosyltransferase n=1 Tax=Halomicronema sp. CCY15110 TaxID=2767773 RepID=UPI001951ED2D|nr:glycosyltransferase [Halomicronema sp. CCY15110]